MVKNTINYMKKPTKNIVEAFLAQSNFIEGEYSEVAFEDSKLAWDYAVKILSRLEPGITVEDILKIHYYLMKTLRPDIAGKIRTGDVWIGGQRKFFISEALIKEELARVCKEINDDVPTTDFPWKRAQRVHVMFEDFHPFFDGNGRTGRILYNLHRLKIGLPIHVIHEGEEQMQYYQWFQGECKHQFWRDRNPAECFNCGKTEEELFNKKYVKKQEKT